MNDHLVPLAEALNRELRAHDNCAYEVLSRKGRAIYFPFGGILGQSAEAKGVAINATIGTATEEDGTPLCLECLERLVGISPESFLYAPSFGLPKLRERWKELLSAKNPSLQGKNFSLPVVVSALTHALSVCGYLFADDGDEIILPDLNWDNYELIFKHGFGAELREYPTFTAGGYNVAGLRDLLMAGPADKKIVLLNFPNNPTGYTETEREAREIRDALHAAAEQGKKIVVLLDDAYFGLVYEEGICRESLFPLLADLHRNVLAVKLDGPTKEDYAWSFRVGFLTFGIKNASAQLFRALETKAAGAVRGNISNSSGIAQALLLKAYQDPDYETQKQTKFQVLRKRYEAIKHILAAHPEYRASFEPTPFNSGYFMCVRPHGADAEVVRKTLLTDYGTGVIVLSGLIRIAFSSVATDRLEKLFANLHDAIQKVKST